jgi:hypothetical protein
MGQPITVVEKPSASNPAILRLETNRPLSGMGHERYDEPPGELLQRPVDELARRLFAAGGVERVHINGSVVTVTLRGGRTGEGLGDIARRLFLHYGETPTDTVDVPLSDADATPDALTDPGDAPSAQESADDAPAPDRPGPADEGADQQVAGIPNAELAPDLPASGTDGAPAATDSAEAGAAGTGGAEPADSAVSEREPSPADPADVAAARGSAAPSAPGAPGSGAAAGAVPEAGEGGPEVEEGPTGAGAGRIADAPDAVITGPTPDVERPQAEPLEAGAQEVGDGGTSVPDPDAGPDGDETSP